MVDPLDIFDIVAEVQVGVDIAAQIFGLVGLVARLLEAVLRRSEGLFALFNFILQVGDLSFNITDLSVVAFGNVPGRCQLYCAERETSDIAYAVQARCLLSTSPRLL